MKFLREDNKVIFCGEYPVDRNDPDAAEDAIELTLPESLSEKAKACWDYFEGAAFAFEYKGRLVLTDEALELTEAGNGSMGNPWGAPRGIFESWDEVETWLEEVYDELKEDEVF